MKYVNEIDVSLPRDRVVQLFADPELRPQWLRGLVSHEPLTGPEGQVGTESRVVFRQGKHTTECIETITRREPVDPPGVSGMSDGADVRFEREIVTEGMRSTTRDSLTALSATSTRWTSEEDYRFSGIMRVLGPLMRRTFVKQSLLHMRDFRAFAEDGTDVRGSDA